MDTSKYVNDGFVTSKYTAQHAALNALTADELEEIEPLFFRKADALRKSGLKTNNTDELRLATKYGNTGQAVRQMWATKTYA